MRIAIIGAGAMGCIYGAHLSLNNEVYLIDTDCVVVDQINKEGLILQENGNDFLYRPMATTSVEELGEMDVIIVFVKALFSEQALSAHTTMIGENTYLMTLQNGAGHEEILSKFVPEERIIIGTTEDNGTVLAPGHVRRGGVGKTNIGMLSTKHIEILDVLKANFDLCGFQTYVHENIQQLIWDKLLVNVSLSAMTGVLQSKMGYIAANEYAWNLTQRLVKEAVQVATTLGMIFDEVEILQKVREISINNPEGITSICADISAGRKTEVNTISGAVVRAAEKCGVEVPTHELIVQLVHALEARNEYKI